MKAMKRNRVVIYISVVTEIILVVLCVIKYIPVYNIYIGKLRAKDLIERLETYKKQHGEYPETLKPIGFPKAEIGEYVEYKGTCYYYIRQSECDFDLEIPDGLDSPIYYSLAEKWFSVNRAEIIKQLTEPLYKKYLLAESSNKLTTSVRSNVTKSEKENIPFFNYTTADSIIFIKKFYDKKHIASKGFALVDVKTKKIKPIGLYLLTTERVIKFLMTKIHPKDKFYHVFTYGLRAVTSKLGLLTILSLMVFSCTLRKPIEVKKHRTDISFINNRDIHFDILKVACDSCFPIHDIGYRVRVKLSADEDSLTRTIKKEQWLQLLQNSATDYAANALLYSLYNRDAIVLLYHRDIEDWRMSMKEDDINYWKGNLRFCKENYKIEK